MFLQNVHDCVTEPMVEYISNSEKEKILSTETKSLFCIYNWGGGGGRLKCLIIYHYNDQLLFYRSTNTLLINKLLYSLAGSVAFSLAPNQV